MAPASASPLVFSAHSPAGSNTPTSYGWSCAPARTAAPPPADSSRPPEWLVLRVHTLPPCTPPGVPQTQLPCNVLELKVWWSTFGPPQTAAYAALRGLLLLRRL